jgi:hypothetical protein
MNQHERGTLTELSPTDLMLTHADNMSLCTFFELGHPVEGLLINGVGHGNGSSVAKTNIKLARYYPNGQVRQTHKNCVKCIFASLTELKT